MEILSYYIYIYDYNDYSITFESNSFGNCSFDKKGKYFRNVQDSECLIFPSKDQRDWNKWDKENNHKIPKTYSELKNSNKEITYNLSIIDKYGCDKEIKYFPIEKSAIALLKIHQLIEVGYGGNVTNEEWISPNYAHYAISLYHHSKHFEILQNPADKHLVLFHTKEQAEEFLSYPENVQLLKEYFIINN